MCDECKYLRHWWNRPVRRAESSTSLVFEYKIRVFFYSKSCIQALISHRINVVINYTSMQLKTNSQVRDINLFHIHKLGSTVARIYLNVNVFCLGFHASRTIDDIVVSVQLALERRLQRNVGQRLHHRVLQTGGIAQRIVAGAFDNDRPQSGLAGRIRFCTELRL